jgi:hypothetical protein
LVFEHVTALLRGFVGALCGPIAARCSRIGQVCFLERFKCRAEPRLLLFGEAMLLDKLEKLSVSGCVRQGCRARQRLTERGCGGRYFGASGQGRKCYRRGCGNGGGCASDSGQNGATGMLL